MCIISENEFISLQRKTHVQDKHTIGTAIDREHSTLLIIVCVDNRKAIVCVAAVTPIPTCYTTTQFDGKCLALDDDGRQYEQNDAQLDQSTTSLKNMHRG